MKVFFRRIHLWLSLAAGIVILICCLTGAILVFQKELEQAFSNNRYFVQQGKEQLNPDILLKAVKENNKAAKINSIKLYANPSRTVEVNISIADKPAKKQVAAPENTPAVKPAGRPPSFTVYVNPNTAAII